VYLRDIFPRSPMLAYSSLLPCEGADMGFDPEFPMTLDDRLRIRTWNMTHSPASSRRLGGDADRVAGGALRSDVQQRLSVIRGHRYRSLRPDPGADSICPTAEASAATTNSSAS